MTLYQLSDLQACEPEAIEWRDEHVRVSIRNERDSMRFDRVDLLSDSLPALIRFVADGWGDDDATGGWFTEVIADIEKVDAPPRYIDADEVPDGFHWVRFSDGMSANTWEGIERDDPTNATYRDLYVLPGVARSIAAEFQHYYPTPEDAHRDMVDWIDVQPHWEGCPLEFVVYNAPAPGAFRASDYDDFGNPKDPNGWGTGNLMDVPAYEKQFPPTVYLNTDGTDMTWLDLGALGLVWYIEETDDAAECDHTDHIVGPDGTCPECGEAVTS